MTVITKVGTQGGYQWINYLRHAGWTIDEDIVREAFPLKEAEVIIDYGKDGIDVLESWSFRYVTNFVWAKDRFGIGYYFRGQHELCLFGVKGNLKPIKRNVPSIIYARRTKHSKKPDVIRDMIFDMSHAPRIELFAREKVTGWDAWGNEI